MSDEREGHVMDVAGAVLDGAHVDWKREIGDSTDPDVRQLIESLELLAKVNGLFGGAPDLAATNSWSGAGGESKPDRQLPMEWGSLQVVSRIGGGGFGTVYRAIDPLEQEVALKVIDRDLREARSQVLEEGRRLARVRHPNLVRVFGVDEHGEEIGLRMELIEGRTLAEGVGAGRFGEREAILIGIDVCRAIAALHGKGILHRDVKAQNVIREEGGRIVLMDLGLALEMRDSIAARSSGGTPLYMAPELLEGTPASVESDLYAVGVLLYHLVSGEYPITAKNLSELQEAHASGDARMLRDVRPDLSPMFLRAIETALARDPGQRFKSAGQMERALTDVLGVVSGGDTPQAAADAAPTGSVPGSTTGPSKRRRALTVGLALAATVVLVAGWLSGIGRGGDATYTVNAQLYRNQAQGQRVPLASGSRVNVGDKLSLELQASEELYAYVFTIDETGQADKLFPLAVCDVANPLSAGVTHELPGKYTGESTNRIWNGDPVYWQVDSEGGEQRVFVVTAVTPQTDLEADLDRLTVPTPAGGAPPQLTKDTLLRLRGMSTLGTARDEQSADVSDEVRRLYEWAQSATDRTEQVTDDVWVRQIVLENPGP